METPAESQQAQETTAPVVEDSAPSQIEGEKPKVEPVKEESQKEPDWFRKRFDEITAKRYDEERRHQETARERDYLRQQLEQQQPKETEKAKSLEDFGYDEGKYRDYVLGEARKAAVDAAKQARAEEQDQVRAERVRRLFKEREASFEKEKPDYREKAHYAPLSEGVAGLVMQAENGPELAYHLGEHKDKALFLNDLPREVAAFELGRIDAQLTAEKAAKKAALDAAKAAKAVSKAPEPTPTIEGSGEPGTVDPTAPDSDKLSDAEWQRRREKQVQRQRKR